MNITLVTASFNDEVHGTFNDKKTGCGINLLKPENVTRFRRGSQMTDLGELTCERCKTRIAREMIKSDKKEMNLILKEERMRAKKGLGDEGIVPLGNTTAKITRAQTAPPPAPEPPAPVAQPEPEPPKPAYQPNGAPALNDDLSQFAISKPVAEEPADPSRQFVPERQFIPEPPKAQPAEDDFLAQFAINKPEEAPEPAAEEDDFLAQFAINAPEPDPVQPAAPPVINDVNAALNAVNNIAPAQPVVNTTATAVDAPDNSTDYMSEWDLIANQLFGGSENEAAPEPAAPAAPVNAAPQMTAPGIQAPVLDEIIPGTPVQPAYNAAPVQAPVLDDIAPVQPVHAAAPAQEPVQAPVLDDLSALPPASAAHMTPPALDDIAAPAASIAPASASRNQAPILDEMPMGGIPVQPAYTAPVQQPVYTAPVQPAPAPVQPVQPAYTAPVQEAPVINDISAALNALNAAPAPAPAPAPAAPVINDISAALNALNAAPAAPVRPAPVQPAPAPVQPAPVQPAYSAPAQPMGTPVLDDISAALNALSGFGAPAPAQPEPEEPVIVPEIPVIPKASASEFTAPHAAAPAPVQQAPAYEELPVLDDIDDDDELEYIDDEPEVQTAPVINDISEALSALNTPVTPVQPAPAPVQPVMPTPAPVQPIAPTPVPVQPVMPAPAPVQPVQPTPVQVQPVRRAPASAVRPVAPAPVQVQPVQAAPIQTANAGSVGQVIPVPYITGYDSLGQPIYTYVQMQIQGYDQTGQPVLAPLPGQNIPTPPGYSSTGTVLDKNIRLRDAIAAAQEIPTSSKDMTPGQRIAAAEAAKGNPVTANVSKIATNAHTRSTSQAFISAISESKEYANQSLTETQGLRQRTGVLNSVEDVLSQLGDNSLKEKRLAEQKAQVNAPVVNEYKPPQPSKGNPFHNPSPSVRSNPAPKPDEGRLLTKSELKAKKKQDKIDAKFQKEMMKRK